MRLPAKSMHMMTITMIEITLSQKPARIISLMRMRPVPKTMAFGGVPTGIMKAHDAPSVAAINMASGCILSD